MRRARCLSRAQIAFPCCPRPPAAARSSGPPAAARGSAPPLPRQDRPGLARHALEAVRQARPPHPPPEPHPQIDGPRLRSPPG
eukprot:scaffold52654_cov75-Phaeocystis_antarctica.AAC.7